MSSPGPAVLNMPTLGGKLIRSLAPLQYLAPLGTLQVLQPVLFFGVPAESNSIPPVASSSKPHAAGNRPPDRYSPPANSPAISDIGAISGSRANVDMGESRVSSPEGGPKLRARQASRDDHEIDRMEMGFEADVLGSEKGIAASQGPDAAKPNAIETAFPSAARPVFADAAHDNIYKHGDIANDDYEYRDVANEEDYYDDGGDDYGDDSYGYDKHEFDKAILLEEAFHDKYYTRKR